MGLRRPRRVHPAHQAGPRAAAPARAVRVVVGAGQPAGATRRAGGAGHRDGGTAGAGRGWLGRPGAGRGGPEVGADGRAHAAAQSPPRAGGRPGHARHVASLDGGLDGFLARRSRRCASGCSRRCGARPRPGCGSAGATRWRTTTVRADAWRSSGAAGRARPASAWTRDRWRGSTGGSRAPGGARAAARLVRARRPGTSPTSSARASVAVPRAAVQLRRSPARARPRQRDAAPEIDALADAEPAVTELRPGQPGRLQGWTGRSRWSIPWRSSCAPRDRRRLRAMSLPLLAALFLVVLALGYRFYGGFVARQYRLDPTRDDARAAAQRTASTSCRRGRSTCFGQHFSAIAAAGPIAGPILACQQFGWLPVHPVDRLRRGLHRRGARLLDAGRLGAPRRRARSPRSSASNLGPRAWLAHAWRSSGWR